MLAFILSKRRRRSSRFTESPPPAVGGGALAAGGGGGLSADKGGFIVALATGFCGGGSEWHNQTDEDILYSH